MVTLVLSFRVRYQGNSAGCACGRRLVPEILRQTGSIVYARRPSMVAEGGNKGEIEDEILAFQCTDVLI